MASSTIANGTIVGGTQTFITNTDETATLPNSAQLSIDSDTAFSAHNTSAQTIATGTFTKVVLSSEAFDLAGTFDSATNYRHTPTEAGKYLYNGTVFITSTANTTIMNIALYLNGSAKLNSINMNGSGGNGDLANSLSTILDMNGTTDYVELYAFHNSGTNEDTIANLSVLSGVKVDA